MISDIYYRQKLIHNYTKVLSPASNQTFITYCARDCRWNRQLDSQSCQPCVAALAVSQSSQSFKEKE